MITSIIHFSQLEGRIDAEYFKPEYLKDLQTLNKVNLPQKTVKEISTSVINFGAYSLCNYIYWVNEGIPFLNVKDIKENYIDFSDVKHVSKEVHEILHKAKVKNSQVLITMAGTLGIAAVVDQLNNECNSNQAIAKITIKEKTINPYFLSTFLNSKFGKLQTEREGTGGVQRNINLGQIQTILIPIPSQQFQQRVENPVKLSFEKRKQAEEKYQEAEKILNKELGIEDFDFKKTERTFYVRFLEINDRLDADYYQPKYNCLLTKIKNKNSKPLKQFIKKYFCGFPFPTEYYLPKGIPLIRIKNLKKMEIDLEGIEYLPDLEEYQPFLANPDNILISMSGTVGLSSIIPTNISKCLINQRIVSICVDGINKLYLCLYLNSKVGNLLLTHNTTGGVQDNISYNDIVSTEIPILSQNIQHEISSFIQQSFSLRQESKELLEKAKKEVEELIEKGREI